MIRTLQSAVATTIAAAISLCAMNAAESKAAVFAEDFSSFSAPPSNFNGLQLDSGLPVAFGGSVTGWSASGAGTAHAVNRAPLNPRDMAVMFWQDNVITLASAIAGSNSLGQSYSVSFADGPAVYQNAAQQTTADDGILVEVLRSDNTVLASHTHQPGAWPGAATLNAVNFNYVGDGSGDVRLRIGPSTLNNGRFSGTLDNLKVTGASDIFSEDFNGFTEGNFNGLQLETGLPVAFGGNLSAWSKSGAGVVHAVNRAALNPQNMAVMFWQDNVITTQSAIAGSNVAGKSYVIDFLAGAAVYGITAQQTAAEDGIRVDVLRSDDSVLASYTYLPGAWSGSTALQTVKFNYTGDGGGDIRLRIGPSNPNNGRFAGTIDNLNLSLVPEPSVLVLAVVALVVGLAVQRTARPCILL